MADSQTEAHRIEVGGRIREVRLERGLTQIDLSRAAGITQASVSNYETGKRELPLSTVLGFAAALDVPLGELIEIPDVIVLGDSRLGEAVRALSESPELLASVLAGESS